MAFSTQVDGDGGGGSVECVTAEEELTLQDYYLQGLLSQGKRLKIPDNVSLGFKVSGLGLRFMGAHITAASALE